MALSFPKMAGLTLPNIQGMEAAGSTATNDDWVRIDVTDGTWTKNDPDTTASSIANSSGVNSVAIDDTSNSDVVNGCVWYKELKTVEDDDFNFTDKPVDFRGYVHWPGTGWKDDGSQVGGDDKPPIASKCYCIMGITTDPENLPDDDVYSARRPKDILGAGLEWTTSNNKIRRMIIRNVSNSGDWGVIDKNGANLDTITSGDVTDSHKASNRLEWQTEIVKAEHLASGNLTPAECPRSYYVVWADRYDNGDRRNINNYAADQRWGRTRTSKLYVFVAVGRGSSGGDALTMEFDCYYHARLLDGGTSPSGKTGLSGP